MMKKIGLWMAIMLLALLVGCSSKEYEADIKVGTKALEQQRYEDALTSFEEAQKVKDTKEIKKYVTLTKHLITSEQAYEEGNFQKAIRESDKIIVEQIDDEVIKVMQGEARKIKKQAQSMNEEYELMKKKYREAKDLFYKDELEKAQLLLTSIMNTTSKHPKIKEVVEDAEKLQARIEEASSNTTEDETTQANTPNNPGNSQPTKPQQLEPQKESKNISKQEAAQLVRTHLKLDGREEVKVEYDHDNAKGDYVIQVYEIIIDDPATGEGHTATWGWYGVNPSTKAIYDAMNE
ncbi:MAG TPA: hypothetical protein VLA13_03520 [Massilibacterium sp.]|nr:hypothetical protein [Massilibacterium sp.]